MTAYYIVLILIAIPVGVIANFLMEAKTTSTEPSPYTATNRGRRTTSLRHKLDNMEDPEDLECAIQTVCDHCVDIGAYTIGVREGFKSIYNELISYYEKQISDCEKDIRSEAARHEKCLETIRLDSIKYRYDKQRLKSEIKEWNSEAKLIGWEEKRLIQKYRRKLAKLKGDKRWLIRKWIKVHLSDDEHWVTPAHAHELDLPDEEFDN